MGGFEAKLLKDLRQSHLQKSFKTYDFSLTARKWGATRRLNIFLIPLNNLLSSCNAKEFLA